MAQGSIRIRCKVCRAAGGKDYCIKKAKDVRCSHSERVYQALYPRPKGNGHDVGPYPTHDDPNKPTAFEQAKRFLAEKYIYYSQHPQYEQPKNLTFGELADTWLKNKEKSVSPKSWTGYDNIIRTKLKPVLGDWKLSSIKPQMLQAIMNSISHYSFSEKTKIHWISRDIFDLGIKNGFIYSNPVEFDKFKNTKPTIYTTLNQDQIRALIDAPSLYNEKHASKSNTQWRRKTLPLMYRLAIFTGIRPSENLAITRDCIDLQKNTLTINKTIYWFKNPKERELAGVGERRWQFRSPKTKAGHRILPLGEELMKEIQIYLLETPENKHNLLFVGPNGLPLKEGYIVKSYFKPDLKRAGGPTIRFYDLRHTYCSMFVSRFSHKPEALQTLQYRMGHENLSTTLKVYTHFLRINNDSMVNEMESFVYGKSLAETSA